MADKAHTSDGEARPNETSQTVAAGQLRALIERIERLEEDKKAIADDIKEIYAEAKGNGFDPKIMRKIVAERRRSAAEVEEIRRLGAYSYMDLARTDLPTQVTTVASSLSSLPGRRRRRLGRPSSTR